MKTLIVYCHPVPESFCGFVLAAALKGLKSAGHDVRVLDLYAMGFNPVMSADERRGYHTPVSNEAPIAEHLEALRWCEALIFVYPTWWYGMPAMLKGWLDRVWVPHATFSMPQETKAIGPVLTNIRILGAISTLGAPWWWWTLVMFTPGRRTLLTGIRAICARHCRTFWLGLHKMDTVSAAERAAFLAKVEKRMAAL
jgi:NAD(P)H dehydrogenase (quinone)